MDQIEGHKKLWFYETMVKIRLFEEKVAEIFAHGLMPGLAHLYIGEEAIATGACGALQEGDYITSTHRGHGHCIAKGGDLQLMMAELTGKENGYCKGKGGSMHIADFSLGILGANGIVGGGIPIATGAGLSIKLRKSNQVALCFLGDGASNQGSFHESLNLASLLKLPVIYIVENNQYGISVHQSRHQAIEDISTRAIAYNMDGEVVDGNDVYGVHAAVSSAVTKARKGLGPSLVECKSYRWRGHHEGDPNQGSRYRDVESILEWKKKCPILRLEMSLLEEGLLTDKEIDRIKEEIKKEVEEAALYAKNSKEPELSAAFEDVYYERSKN